MTPCARGCCWTAFQVCATQRACPCHWADQNPRNEPRTSDAAAYKDPTANTAIWNLTRKNRRNK